MGQSENLFVTYFSNNESQRFEAVSEWRVTNGMLDLLQVGGHRYLIPIVNIKFINVSQE